MLIICSLAYRDFGVLSTNIENISARLRGLFCRSNPNYSYQKRTRYVSESKSLHYELFVPGGKRNEGRTNGGEADRSNLGDEPWSASACNPTIRLVSARSPSAQHVQAFSVRSRQNAQTPAICQQHIAIHISSCATSKKQYRSRHVFDIANSFRRYVISGVDSIRVLRQQAGGHVARIHYEGVSS